MADNNRNWNDSRSNQDWNDSDKRYGGNDYNDRYRRSNRYEGSHGDSDWPRSDYGQGSTYGEQRYDRDHDYNKGGHGGWGEDYNRGSRRGGSYGSSYGDNFDDRGYNSDYYNRSNRRGSDYGSSGYGGSGLGGNSYGSNYGNSYGSRSRGEGYGGGFGFGERSNFGERNFGSYDRGSGYSDWRDRQRRSDYSRGGSEFEDRNWWDKTADEVSSWFGDEDAERRRRMDRAHKGRGPKNYQRSDERIKEDINDRLSDDWFIDASEVEVTVTNGEATLTGTVSDRTDKRRAEDIAESVSGVKHVENRLRVTSNENRGSSSYTTTPGATSIGTGVGSSSGVSKSKSSYADTK